MSPNVIETVCFGERRVPRKGRRGKAGDEGTGSEMRFHGNGELTDWLRFLTGHELESSAGSMPAKQALEMTGKADCPTDLIQPAFEILRKHRNFRVAWIFGRGKGEPTAAGGRRYQFLVLMEPRDAAIFHEFNLVVQSAAPPHEADLGYLDENNADYIANLWRQVAAFYIAPDYERPPGAKS